MVILSCQEEKEIFLHKNCRKNHCGFLRQNSLLKKYIIEKSCTKLKFTSTLFKGWQGVKGGRATLSLPQKRNTLN